MTAGRGDVANVLTPEPRTVAALAERLRRGLDDTSLRQAHDVVAALLDVPRFWPATHGDAPVEAELAESAVAAVAMLRRGAPFAYAVGRAAFRHLTLRVDERVLIPRPETELIVDEIFRLAGPTSGTAIDIGTGSGAIALALASEGAFDRVIATDVSRDALAVAAMNAAALAGTLRTRVEFRHGALFAPVAGERATVVVSNPPYIAFDEAAALPASVRDWEPALALVSEQQGMAATIGIVRGAAAALEPDGVLALEVDVRRAAIVAELVMEDGRYADVAVRMDLTGRERFVVARRA